MTVPEKRQIWPSGQPKWHKHLKPVALPFVEILTFLLVQNLDSQASFSNISLNLYSVPLLSPLCRAPAPYPSPTPPAVCLSVSFVSIKDSILLDLIEWLSLYRIPTTDRASTITPIAQNKNPKNLKACKGALEKRRVLAGFARKLKKARKTRLDSLAIPVM